MLSGEVTFSSCYRSTQVNVSMATKALPGPEQIPLMTFCGQLAATVDFSTCRCGWAVFTGSLSTQSASASRWMSAHGRPRVSCVWLWCVLCPCQQRWSAWKEPHAVNATVSEADIWSQTSLTTAGSRFPWLELVIGVFSIRAEKVQPASTSVMEPQAQHICVSVKEFYGKITSLLSDHTAQIQDVFMHQ